VRDRLNNLVAVLGVVVSAAGCGASTGSDGHPAGGSGGGGVTAGSAGAGGSPGLSGAAGEALGGAGAGGAVSTAGAPGGGAGGLGAGATGGAAGAPGTAGSTGGAADRGGSGGGAAGADGSGGGKGGASGTGGSGAAGAAGGGTGSCKLPATVSFQKDVQPFLSTTCGGGGGCHVIDSASTTANGGYDHAYDWITAGAHPSSCPETPTPKRFEIVLAVIAAADPPSCSKSRLMPPQDETGADLRAPLTSCEIATLQAWLDEPLVTQAHRVYDTDPAGTPPFPMPPFN
jgi:hypothetical protein